MGAFRFLMLSVFVAGALLVASPGRQGAASEFTAVGAGGQHTCAKTSDDGVTCWGRNNLGQLGDATYTDSGTPVQPVGLATGVQDIAIGGWHSCVLTPGDTVKCWGLNNSGQLGIGTANLFVNTPTEVCASGSGGSCVPLSNVDTVIAGGRHTCAITSAGAALCWGINTYGEVGDGTNVAAANPVSVTGLGSGVAALALGDGHSCALTTAGAVKCWGRNTDGQLGDGTRTHSNVPVDVDDLSSGVGAISAGGSHSCALVSDAPQCWGNNDGRQLGIGVEGDRMSPTDVCATGSGGTCVPLVDISSISAGDAHTCAVTDTGGLKCWGWDGFGQLGDGTASFFEFQLNPADVPGLSGAGGDPDVASLDSGSGHTCVVTTAQVVKCWGWNSHGQLGDGSAGDNPSAENRDFDRDGCQDEAELGSVAADGGLRNPKYYWDFYDTPDASNVRDKLITILDLNRVAARFGANDNGGADPINRFSDPLTAPPPAPAYHPAFDRGSVIGPNPWDKAPADGIINLIDDILGVAAQFGHTCL